MHAVVHALAARSQERATGRRIFGGLSPVDVLAANAGLSRPGSYEDIDASAFDETLAVNLRAPYMLARAVLPSMRARKFGRILFTSSVAALTGGIVGPHYAASKAGLHGLAHFLAARAAHDGHRLVLPVLTSV